MNTLLEIQNEIVFISNAHASKETIKTKIIDTHWIEEPRVTVCDSEVVQAMNRMKDYKNELETWEKSFFCLGCRAKGRENFSYLVSSPAGEEHRCDCCNSIIYTPNEPTRKK